MTISLRRERQIFYCIVTVWYFQMSPKKWSKNTFGWARAEVLGALVNAVFLTALCFSILVESLKRLYENEPIHNPQMMLYVGVIGLVVNVIGLFLFHGAFVFNSNKTNA